MGARSAAIFAVAAAAAFAFLWPAAAPGHKVLHLNCPPGSHATAAAKPGVARKLWDARAQALEARSVTSGHPSAPAQPNAPK